jgi:hypothetical protein
MFQNQTTSYAHVIPQKDEIAEARGAAGKKGARGNTVFTGGTTF